MRTRYGGYGGFAPYVPVAKRKAKGEKAVAKIAKKLGRAVEPVAIEGRHITTTFWGNAWCDNLEHYSDFSSRLPRGRTYAKNGSVLDLRITPGEVEAYVAGSELYTVKIAIKRLAPARWQQVIARCSGRIGSLIGLLRGELAHDVLMVLTQGETSLFPAPREIDLRCSCPDGASMCKHVAAALYGVGARLDLRPELFFLLRQVDQAELIGSAVSADVLGAAGARATPSGKRRLATSAVASVFGIELDETPPAALKSGGDKKKAASKKPKPKPKPRASVEPPAKPQAKPKPRVNEAGARAEPRPARKRAAQRPA